MRVNLEWLREWVDLHSDAEEIAAALTTAGLEVDSVERAGPPLAGIVVAQVLAVERHPNADRLAVCTVDDGLAHHQVVCGAPNVAPGIKAPFARVGAKLPSGKAIGAAELRGVQSNGMLCSAKELELLDDAVGLLLLDQEAPLGVGMTEYLQLDDAIFEVNVTPNRGDCFSVVGIARELAARGNIDLRQAPRRDTPTTIAERFPVVLGAGASCPRFVGRVVRGLNVGRQSPLWLRTRLIRAGLRPIQPIVDVTNYVMLELGQPLHAYDFTKLQRGIEVRMATANESLVLLDGKSVTLGADVLVIADGNGPVGLAGIMGGQSTAVDTATTSVFLESAFFAPAAIAGRARRYGLHTDASLRFERGVDPTGQGRAIERATQLLLEICGGEVGPVDVVEQPSDLPQRQPVKLRRERLLAVLGLIVPDARVESLLQRLGMLVESDAHGWRVTPPPFRFDIAIEEDLIEEVGRMVGYDRIPPTPGTATERLGSSAESVVAADRLADLLMARGYTEVINYSFVDPALEEAVNPGVTSVHLTNPIASDMAVLRRSLWPGLMTAARQNLSHQRQRFKLFELGPQFALDGADVQQTTVLAGLALGSRTPEHWDGTPAPTDFFDVKGDVEALLRLTGRFTEFEFEPATHPALRPGQTARIRLGEATVGWLGALHPDLQNRVDRKRAAVVFALQVDATFAAVIPAFRSYSKFPSIRRDLSIVVDETVSSAALKNAARIGAGSLLQAVIVFDVYRGTGVDSRRKSIGLGLILQDVSRTLTDADADETMRSVTLRLEREFGATIRT
jgi:phenylalanyl-tRNA synthetase beta chain